LGQLVFCLIRPLPLVLGKANQLDDLQTNKQTNKQAD
jgi:hypothetical protein